MAIGFLNAPSLQRSNFQSTATQRDYTNATNNTDTVVEENIRMFVQIYLWIYRCVLYETFRNFIATATRADCRGYVGKV